MEKLEKLIHYLASDLDLPQTQEEQEWALRALMNIWEPKVMPAEFWTLQDAYLQEKLAQKKLTRLSDLQEVEPQIYLWQGDITSLQVDAIVNAANSQLLG
ncbi:TPA: protein-ADP-ribose hydrolase, partial [Streptococcus suis]